MVYSRTSALRYALASDSERHTIDESFPKRLTIPPNLLDSA